MDITKIVEGIPQLDNVSQSKVIVNCCSNLGGATEEDIFVAVNWARETAGMYGVLQRVLAGEVLIRVNNGEVQFAAADSEAVSQLRTVYIGIEMSADEIDKRIAEEEQ